MKDFWNERYGNEEYAYGTDPNEFLKEQLSKLEPGTLLLPGDGEGRNSVWAARQGWKVKAFDMSREGKKKTMRLANRFEVSHLISYEISMLQDFQTDASFDAIASIFFHVPPQLRRIFHKRIRQWLRPNGVFILEAFTPKQVINQRESGGPPTIEMMDAENELKDELSYLDIIYCQELVVELNEGPFHSGKADVVRFLGRKI